MEQRPVYMRPFLTQEEVAELTGYKRRSLQVAWLAKNRVPFFVNGVGLVIVPTPLIEGGMKARGPQLRFAEDKKFELGPVR